MNKPTLTIGIAAYNEEKTIGHLLADLLRQKFRSTKLKQIIIVNDGSSDQTQSVVNKYSHQLIKCINLKRRQGLAACLNLIFQQATSDILVTLDADIRLQGTSFFDTLVSPIVKNRADFTTSSIEESQTKSFFAHSIILSMQIKRELYRSINQGNNLYTSFGLARAYSRQLYKVLHIESAIGNDMYTYLYAIASKYRFLHVPQAVVTYQAPRTLSDYRTQSARYFQAKVKMKKLFNDKLVADSLKIPLRAYWQSLPKIVRLVSQNPLHLLAYLGFLLYSYASSFFAKVGETWTIASTTKQEVRV